jgi:hypothetical protein
MAMIVGVHGIGQQFKGPEVQKAEWLNPLRDGVALAGGPQIHEADLTCAFYGDLFRPSGTKGSVLGAPPYDESDVADPWEQQLLEAWWREAAVVEPDRVESPDAATKLGRTPRFVQRALDALSHSRFFAGIAERAFIFDLKQVYLYLHDQAIRRAVRARAEAVVDAQRTRVLIGHSLGSVVAYECLCAHPEWSVNTLVTLGSPLGIRNLIFDLLDSGPSHLVGAWPGSVRSWVNIADQGDIVALVKDLSACFGPRVENRLIHNGATAHNLLPYLTARETGDAIAAGLD